jgi:hypothetical protein
VKGPRARLLDHFICGGGYSGRCTEAERACRPEIVDQFELDRLLDWKVGRARPFQTRVRNRRASEEKNVTVGSLAGDWARMATGQRFDDAAAASPSKDKNARRCIMWSHPITGYDFMLDRSARIIKQARAAQATPHGLGIYRLASADFLRLRICVATTCSPILRPMSAPTSAEKR